MYRRNRIYITPEEQEKIKNTRILIAGAGLGSNIAECILRMGFLNITICDMDDIEVSNLNRQNYTWFDVKNSKAKTLGVRLKSINPNAIIKCHHLCLTESNSAEFIENCDIAINTMDFTSNAPFIFDDICLRNNIPVLHPYNLGWTACVFVITTNSNNLNNLITDPKLAELEIIEHIIMHNDRNIDINWLKQALVEYKEENGETPPPQLAPASFFTAGLCANILYKIANKQTIKTFPKVYLIDA